MRAAVREGNKDTPPLLLCNGIGAGLELLQPFVDHLDPAIPVIRFDVPGVGGSPLPRMPYLMTCLSRTVTTLVAQLGYPTFDVLGISWGGALAQQIAFQNPRRCRRMVLASTATGSIMVPARPSVLAKMITPRRYRDPGHATSVAADIYGGRLRAEPELVTTLLTKHAPHPTDRGYQLQLLASAGWTSLPFLPMIRQPTLILTGDDDPIVPTVNARIMARLLPHAKLHVFNDGHLGLVTLADELGPLVSEFLSGPLSTRT
ncbi:poly(3-hydroxyalkanoate) depolymerase [Nocardia fluminea]